MELAMKYLPVGIIIASSLMNPIPVLATTNDAQMVAFFPIESEVCPTGWSEYKPAKGYLIRGTDNTSLIGAQKGDAIHDAQAPLHQHKLDDTLPLRRIGNNIFGGPHQRITTIEVSVNGSTSHSDGAMPYVQYLTCQEDKPAVHEPSLSIFLPKNTVQWFTGGACPTGWALYEPLIGGSGRTALPLPRDAVATAAAAIVDGSNSQNHEHNLFFNMPDKEHNIKLMVNSTDDSYFINIFKKTDFAQAAIPQIERLSAKGIRSDIKAGSPDVLIPYTYLRPCQKTSDTINISELPAGMGTFTKSFACPSGLYNVASAAGRFPVGLPPRNAGDPDPLSGTAFGAAALKSEQRPTHLHTVDIPVALSAWGIDTTTFLPTNRFKGLSPGASKLEGETDTTSMTFPYVQLKFCKVPE
jgi:hypothetical protein